MTALSQFSQGVIADYIAGTDMPAVPAALFLALSSADPLDTGANIVEPGGAYARQSITLSAPNTTNAEGTTVVNSGPIQFSGVVGQVTHLAVFDALTGGNMIYFAPLDVVRTVTAGDTVSYAAGVVKLTIGGLIAKYLGEAFCNWMRGNAAPAAPIELNLGLSLTAANRDGTGITYPAITDGYAHEVVTFDAFTFVSGAGTTITSNNDIVFGPAHTGPWGTITYCVLLSGDDNSQLLQGPSSHPVLVPVGDGVGLVSGAVSFLVA